MSNAPEDRNRRVEDYVRGQTDDETARQLEIEMLEDDDLFERVQTEDLLRRGLGESERVPSSIESEGGQNTGFLPRLGWALAASFGAVALMLGVYSLQLNERITVLHSPEVGVPIHTISQQRSPLASAQQPPLDLAGHDGPVLLEFDVSGLDNEHYSVEITFKTSSMSWQLRQPDERGYLTVMIPNGSAVEEIRISGPDDKTIHSYTAREDDDYE